MSNHNNKTANAFLNLIEVIKKLRSPEGCPWGQKQTQKSLIPYLLEETYEVIESIEENNVNMLKEELGDLILHILFQAEIAFEKEQFNIYDSIKNVTEKLINRHPLVFNNDQAETRKITILK